MEPIATTAAAAVTAYASQVVDAARRGSDRRISGTPMVVRFFEELAARDREAEAAVTLVTAEPTDPARVDLLASLLAARATADPLLGERLRELVHSVQELQRTRSSIERDLQFAAHQRLVALAVDLGMARADLETGPADAIAEGDHEAPSTEAVQEAERWFRKAAAAGFHPAQFNLGALLVERGEFEEAAQWLGEAATTSDPRLASRAKEALDRLRDDRGS